MVVLQDTALILLVWGGIHPGFIIAIALLRL